MAGGATEPPSEETADPLDGLVGRGPVLELSEHTVQVVSAEYSPNVPELADSGPAGWEPAPSGGTYLQVMLRLEAIEAGRQTEPPVGRIALFYPECEEEDFDDDFGLWVCGALALEQTDYLTAEQVAAGDPYGVVRSGHLEADTPYFLVVGTPASEDRLPADPQLCEVDPSGDRIDNCIPVGETG